MKAIRWSPEQLAEYERRRTPHTGPQPARLEREASRHMRGVDIDAIHRLQPPSKLERRFDQQIEEAGLPPPKRNWFFLNGRDFELDRAWPAKKVAVEVQGMAHRIKGKFQRDIEKRALALLAGWRVLEVDGKSIRDGRAIEWAKRLVIGEESMR